MVKSSFFTIFLSGDFVSKMTFSSRNNGFHEDINKLVSVSQLAPFGKGSETVIDETVRKGLQIDSSLVTFRSPASWETKLDSITQELKRAYGRENITLKLYKMLLYEQGGFFLSHKDTLRDKHHIASLLITLPVEEDSQGGVLRVTGPAGAKEVMEWDGRCDDLDASWCSFYTDCQHELLPVTKGKRVVLAYEVHSNDAMEVKAEDDAEMKPLSPKHPVTEVIDYALTQRQCAVILLKHQYPSDCQAKHLKGYDRTLFEFLQQHYKTGHEVLLQEMELKIEQDHNYDVRYEHIRLMTYNVEFDFPDPIIIEDKESVVGAAVSETGEDSSMTNRNKDTVEPVEKNEDEYDEDDEDDYGDERDYPFDGIDDVTQYFKSDKAAFLFTTKDLGFMGPTVHKRPAERTGNEAANGEMMYRFYTLTVKKT